MTSMISAASRCWRPPPSHQHRCAGTSQAGQFIARRGGGRRRPQRIELHFSGTLVKQFSGANLVMTGMPGMSDHAAMKVASSVSGGDDPKTMLITPKSPLVPGTYRVEWRAVSSDTHSITGAINFKVN